MEEEQDEELMLDHPDAGGLEALKIITDDCFEIPQLRMPDKIISLIESEKTGIAELDTFN